MQIITFDYDKSTEKNIVFDCYNHYQIIFKDNMIIIA